MPHARSDRASLAASAAGRARGFRSWTEAVKPLSWANALPFGPLTLAAQSRSRAGRAIPALTLGASAGGQQGLSSARVVECGCGGMVCAARLCAVALSLWRGHGAGSRLARATLLSECASCVPRRTWARGSRAAEALRGGGRRDAPRPARPGALVPVDDRQRMAAPVTGCGVPAVMGEGGRPDRGRPSRSDPGQPSGSNLADYLK